MTLAALIKKRSVNFATAIPVTPKGEQTRTVAGIATIAVANPTELKTETVELNESQRTKENHAGEVATAIPAIPAISRVEQTRKIAEIARIAIAKPAESKKAHGRKEVYEERAAILQYDAHLDRPAAERASHHLVFCRDCVHHLPQPTVVSRSGFPHATPSGCKLGLITPDSWPPVYRFSGWCCSRHSKIIKGP